MRSNRTLRLRIEILLAFILFTLSLATAVTPPKSMYGSYEEVEKTLTANGWRLDVRQGRIAIESRILTFCPDGRLRERVFDDTGMHESFGTWSVEHKDDIDVLVLVGEALRDRGRFVLRYSKIDLAIDLRHESSEQTMRFLSEKKMPNTKCSPN